MNMRRKPKKCAPGESFRLNPDKRLCPQFDAAGVKLYGAPAPEMGVRVVDDTAQEHIM